MSIVPTIALGIGVVVAGLGIGAFLSALQRNTANAPATAPTVGAMVITPVPQPTRDALAMQTPIPHATSSPTPQASPSHSAVTTSAPTATATAASTVTPAATPTPAPTPHRSASPHPTPTALVVKIGVIPNATATPVPRAASFAEVAESTVRRYIDAVISGNDASAYAAFGATPGDPNVRLTEAAFVDRSSHIISLRTTHSDATGSTIGVEVSSSHGSYYITYHVSRAPGGAVIDGHDYIRE